MKHYNLIFNFTHTYPKQLIKDTNSIVLDCTNIIGCTDYCSDEAKEEIRKLIQPYGISGIHFLDSGDYHYISEILTDFIKEPFTLILIDHHTDMQTSLIDNLTSCGNWAKEVLNNNKYLQQLVLIGQEDKALKNLNISNKLIGISYEELLIKENHLKLINKNYPIYISIDKDVLNTNISITDWDQGKMTLEQLEILLLYLIKNNEILGIDICGDYPLEEEFPKYRIAQRINTESDEELYQFILKLLREQ